MSYISFAEAFRGAMARMFVRMFCIHNWVLFQQMVQKDPYGTNKGVVFYYQCPKCGRIKRIQEKIKI